MTEKTPPRETPRRLPRTIVRTLRLLILRARLAIAVRGIGTVVALAIGSLLVVMAIDACVVVFASPVRYALTLLALSATVVGMLLLLIRPLARSLTLDGIARAIELHHPELQERISSSVELLSSKDAPELRGSDALIAALVNEAQDDVRTIRPGREITLRRARPPLLLAVLLAALLTELLLLWPVKTSRLLLRAVGPHLNLPNISAEDLTITPGDTVITRGQILRIDVEVADKSVRRADLRIPASDGTETAERMARLFDPDSKRGRFTFTCPPAERTFSYRVHAGGAVSCYYTVTVVPFPAVTGIDLRYDYPEYTQLQPRIEADATGDIAALAGTTVTVTARTNTRVGSAEMLVDGEPLSGVQTELVATGDGTTDCVFRFKMAAGLSGRWEAEFADVHGFANTPVQHDLEALPDAAPTVAVWQPEEKRLRMSPDDKLPLGYAIGDDYGVSGAEVVMETDRGTIPSIPVPLSAQEEGRQETTGGPQRAVAGTVLLDLSALDLKGVSRLTFRLRATDSLPEDMQGPQEAFSDPYTIEFDVEAPSYAEQLLLTWEEDIRKALQEILDELAAAKKESTDVLPEVARPGDLDQAAQERIDRMHEHLDAADGSARELAQRVAWSMYGFLAPKLRATADNHISRADNLAGQVQLTEEPQQRGKLADEADLQIDLAVAAVSEMVEQFDAVAEAARRQQELQELAEQQTDLADTKYAMEEGPPDGQTAELAMSPDAWAELQREVATDVDAVLGEAMREASEELRARDLAAEARRLQEEQERLRDATKRLRTAQALDSAIAELAREQEELAEEAAADDLSAPQTGRMRDAAEKIRNYDLEPAIARQGEAAGALEARARSLRAELLAEEIARKAEQIAQQQKQLAEGAEQARQDPGTPYPGGLGERQQKLTEQMQQLTKEAAKATRYTQEALKKHSPAGQMQQATQAVQKAQTDRGALAAAVEAEAGARDAAAKAAQEKARAEDAAAKAKQDKADATLATAKARVAAENAERTAAEAKEAAADAEQAQARARDAQARAREAEASAKEAEARSDERQAQATDALAKAQEAQTTAKAAEAKAQQALAGAGEAADEAANTTTRAAEGAQKLAEELRKAAERSSPLADKPQRAQGIEQLARRQR
ncbi:MAG: DUF4175 family protein, partial [Candidatus Brocadiae bacterium]|nr:DUF4175 family protein [Candidatus Brocadiia bacterium]